MKRRSSGPPSTNLGEIPMMSLYREPVPPAIGRVAKRALDVLGSCFGLVALSPLLGHRRNRHVGLRRSGPLPLPPHGEEREGFDCYKFRTMIMNA